MICGQSHRRIRTIERNGPREFPGAPRFINKEFLEKTGGRSFRQEAKSRTPEDAVII